MCVCVYYTLYIYSFIQLQLITFNEYVNFNNCCDFTAGRLADGVQQYQTFSGCISCSC